jgi:type I restriction enzyme S subunit
MIEDLKPYPKMKESGVPWLGEVPEHWEVRAVGGLGALFKGNGGNKNDEVPTGIPCVRYGDLYTRHEFFITTSKACVSNERAGAYTSIRHGDILFAASGETIEDIGRSAVNLIEGEARCGGDVLVLRPEVPVVPRYLGYASDSPPSRHQKACMGRGFTVVHIYGGELKRLALPFPPLPEQAAIVRFLDYADRRIRRYIRAKQKLIKLLEEQKQAIIHRAVTRGLDPNVRLKPSGVEWLGDVPEHWDVLPLCAIARPRKQTNQPHRELLSVYLGRGVIPFSAVEEKRTNPTSEDLSKYQVVEPGDFVLNNQQAWRGSVGVSRYQGIVSPAYLVLRLDGRLLVEFADRLLSGRAMVAQYLVSSKGVGSIQRNLYWPHLRRVAVLVPPAVEQAAIARYLNEATASLTTTIEREGHEIALLREFRTRLITDVVTGKLDVREAAARLPDEAEEPEPPDEIEAEGDADDAGVGDADEMIEEAET